MAWPMKKMSAVSIFIARPAPNRADSYVIGSVRAPCKGVELRRVKVPSGRLVVPPGSSRNSRGGNESAEASDVKGSHRRLSKQMGRNRGEGMSFASERRAGLETKSSGRRPRGQKGKAAAVADKGPLNARNKPMRRVRRGSGDGTSARRATQHGRPIAAAAAANPESARTNWGRSGSRIGS